MSVTFTEDSEVKIIKSCAFTGKSISFQILKSLEIFEPLSFIMKMKQSPLISVSNHLFTSPDSKYLFSKSQKELDYFDTLVYITPDIEEANIPSNIKIIKQQAFTNFKSFIFSDDSQLEIIEGFQSYKLTKVFIPNNLQSFGEDFFSGIKEVIISPTNKRYKYLDNKYLLKKSDINNDIYDELVWIRKESSLFEEEHFKPQFYDDISVSKEKLDILFEYVRSLEKKTKRIHWN